MAFVEIIGTRVDGNSDLVLRLLRPDSSEVGNRRVSVTGTCDDMAEAVATILAAWETNPESEGTTPDESAGLPVKEEPRIHPTAVSAPSTISDWNVVVGAGAGAAFIGGVAAGGIIEVALGKGDSHWQLRTGVSAQTARTLKLSNGHADWQHTSIAAGLLWRTLGPVWRLSLDAGPVAGWETISGTGFTPSRQQRVFEYGGTAGLRVGRTWGRWTLWAETRANLWLPSKRATAKSPVSGQVVASGDVPVVDAIAELGMSVALFP